MQPPGGRGVQKIPKARLKVTTLFNELVIPIIGLRPAGEQAINKSYFYVLDLCLISWPAPANDRHLRYLCPYLDALRSLFRVRFLR